MKIRVHLHCSEFHYKPYIFLFTNVSSEDEAQELQESLEKFSNSPYGDNMRYFYFGNIGMCARDREFKELLSDLETFTKIKFCLQDDGQATNKVLSLTVK